MGTTREGPRLRIIALAATSVIVAVGVVTTVERNSADAESIAAPGIVMPNTDEQWSAPVPATPLAARVANERAIQAAIAQAAAEKAAAEKAAADRARREAERQRQQAAAARAAADKRAREVAQRQATKPAPRTFDSGIPDSAFDSLAQCESRGNPLAVSANGRHYGAFQFSLGTWAGLGYEGSPTDYNYEYQREAARKLQARSGWGQWPHCSRKLGFL